MRTWTRHRAYIDIGHKVPYARLHHGIIRRISLCFGTKNEDNRNAAQLSTRSWSDIDPSRFPYSDYGSGVDVQRGRLHTLAASTRAADTAQIVGCSRVERRRACYSRWV